MGCVESANPTQCTCTVTWMKNGSSLSQETSRLAYGMWAGYPSADGGWEELRQGGTGAVDGAEWACERCTFLNGPQWRRCEMCDARRPAAPADPHPQQQQSQQPQQQPSARPVTPSIAPSAAGALAAGSGPAASLAAGEMAEPAPVAEEESEDVREDNVSVYSLRRHSMYDFHIGAVVLRLAQPPEGVSKNPCPLRQPCHFTFSRIHTNTRRTRPDC